MRVPCTSHLVGPRVMRIGARLVRKTHVSGGRNSNKHGLLKVRFRMKFWACKSPGWAVGDKAHAAPLTIVFWAYSGCFCFVVLPEGVQEASDGRKLGGFGLLARSTRSCHSFIGDIQTSHSPQHRHLTSFPPFKASSLSVSKHRFTLYISPATYICRLVVIH